MPTLGLCVIARNASGTLRACLESVEGLVDAIMVVDTGSTDETSDISRACGASVISFPWNDDFSAPRNRALAAIGTDWVLVLDADEELDKRAHAWIREELKTPNADGYVTPVRNYLQPWDEPLTGKITISPGERHPRAPDACSYVHSEVCRLFRRDPDIYYVGHVHEQVEYRMIQLGRPIGRAGFFIHHFGWYVIDEMGIKRKRELYGNLLREKLRQRPNDPQVMLQYGDALCTWFGKVEEGLSYFMKAVALNKQQPGAWMYIAQALLKLNQMEAALIAIEQIPIQGEHAGIRAQLKGEALEALHRGMEARVAYQEALAHCPDSISMQARLAFLELQDGSREQGLRRMQGAIAQAEAEAFRGQHAHPFLRAAELHALIQQWPEALQLLQAGLIHHPDSLPLMELRLRASVATNKLEEAAEAAAHISKLNPAPRSILRHAAILNQSGKRNAAIHVIAQGLEQFSMSDELRRAQCELGAMVSVAPA